MMIRLLLSLLLILLIHLHSSFALDDAVIFGVIDLQLRSRSNTPQNEFLFQILSRTGTYIDDTLQRYFTNDDNEDNEDDNNDNNNFNHVTLAVNDFAMETTTATEGGQHGEQPTTYYDAFVQLQGTALFQSGTAPSKEKVRQVVQQALEEGNKKDFVDHLKASKDPMLRDITFAEVTVSAVDDDDNGGEQGQQDGSSSQNAASDDNNKKLPTWAIGVIAASCALCFVFSFCMCYTFYCSSSSNTTSSNHPHHATAAPKTRPSVQTNGTTDDEDEDDSHNNHKISPTSSDDTPSDLHSITSQNSSVFTYNPNYPSSRGSVSSSHNNNNSNDESSSTKSFFSGASSFNTTNPQVKMDVEAWQRGSTITSQQQGQELPFGHDISAIEPLRNHNSKDLSLIEEGDDESRASSSQQSTSNHSSSASLSQKAVRDLERAERRTASAKTTSLLSLNQYESSSLQQHHAAATVMEDLDDLSAQIHTHRGRYSYSSSAV